MRNIALYIGILFFVWNCKKEIGPQNLQEEVKGVGNLIVLNEGNFGFGNASVSIYNPETKEIFNNQFKTENGFGIGDVLQSVKRHEDKLYFVINNSGKIVITDTNLVYQTEITGFNSPRYIEFANGNGFVTDLKQKAVYVVDLASNQITNQIKTEGWTEHILAHQNRLYIMDRGDYLSNSGPNKIYIIDPIAKLKIDSIATSISPNSMVIDKNSNLWVLTSGKSGAEVPKLSKYSLTTNSLMDEVSFFSSSSPSRLVKNESSDELYYINSSIYRFSINDTVIPSVPFFNKSSENFYGLFYEKNSKELYLIDAKNYNEQGEVIRVSSSAIILDRFLAGIIPQNLN